MSSIRINWCNEDEFLCHLQTSTETLSKMAGIRCNSKIRLKFKKRTYTCMHKMRTSFVCIVGAAFQDLACLTLTSS